MVGLVDDIEEYVKDPTWFNALFREMGIAIPNRQKVIDVLKEIDEPTAEDRESESGGEHTK